MSILNTDLIVLGPASRPESDAVASGGAIDPDYRPTFVDIVAVDNIEVLSSSAGDTTQVLTVKGRNAAGAFISENINLNGTTQVVSTNLFERILSVSLGTDCAGIVTVRRATGDTLIGTIPIGERGFYANFIKSVSAAAPVSRYEKIFWKNAHATLTLNDAKVTLTADPSARIMIALAASKNDSGSVANRLATPGLTFSDDSVELAVPADTLEAGSAIGTWIEQALQASDSPFKSTFSTRLNGTSVAILLGILSSFQVVAQLVS